MSENKKRVYRVYVAEDTNPFVVTTMKELLEQVETIIDENDIGDAMIIVPIEMTDDEIADMPDWVGP